MYNDVFGLLPPNFVQIHFQYLQNVVKSSVTISTGPAYYSFLCALTVFCVNIASQYRTLHDNPME